MSAPVLPDRLRRQLADLQPVRPLPHPALRTLEVATWALALFVLVPLAYRIRQDASTLGWPLVWGAAIAQALVGLLLAGLALREAIPGAGIGPARASVALALGLTTQFGVGLLSWLKDPVLSPAEMARHRGLSCVSAQEILGASGLAFAFWLILRALPVRPRWAGALAGMAAALVADAVWHLICPRSDLPHVLVSHGGATVLTTAWGWLLGVLYERREAARLTDRS
jgi:hypothetical protein